MKTMTLPRRNPPDLYRAFKNDPINRVDPDGFDDVALGSGVDPALLLSSQSNLALLLTNPPKPAWQPTPARIKASTPMLTFAAARQLTAEEEFFSGGRFTRDDYEAVDQDLRRAASIVLDAVDPFDLARASFPENSTYGMASKWYVRLEYIMNEMTMGLTDWVGITSTPLYAGWAEKDGTAASGRFIGFFADLAVGGAFGKLKSAAVNVPGSSTAFTLRVNSAYSVQTRFRPITSNEILDVLNNKRIGLAIRGEVAPTVIADALRGTTPRANEIADAIACGRIKVHILPGKQFNATYLRLGGTAPSLKEGFNVRGRIFLRQGAEDIFGTAVHEGTHALDYLNPATRNISRLYKELEAYNQQRFFHIKTGVTPNFHSSDKLIDFVLDIIAKREGL